MTSDSPTPSRVLYGRLLRYVRPYRRVFAAAVVAMAVTSATDPAFAALMRPMLDGGFIHRDPESIRRVPLLLVVLFLVRGFAAFASDFTMQWVGRKVIFDLRNALFRRMVGLRAEFFDRQSSASLVSHVIYDVEQVATASTRAISVLVKDGLAVVGLIAWMTYLNWRLTLIFGLIGPPAAFVVRRLSRRFRRTSSAVQESMAEIAQSVQELVQGYKVVKIFGGQSQAESRFAGVNENNRRQLMRRARAGATASPVIQLLAAAALAGVIYVAMVQAAVTVGSFISYIAAIMLLLGPTRRLTQINEPLQSGLAASESIFRLLDSPLGETSGSRRIDRVRGRIEYDQVSFAYPGTPDPALHDISFAVEPGTMVALVGASGSGKSTIASLLPRFYDPTAGEIRLDGVALPALSIDDLRSHIALVTQDTVLFDDSIRHNILYGHIGPVSHAQLEEAIMAAHVAEFTEGLPDGLDTRVGERGLRLSGGQRQRIAIARALIKNAPILILDEATSALDSESERHVQDAMARLVSHRTTLVIAHRLSTIERADRILVLAKGRIIESGSHRELLAAGRTYARLHQLQFHGHQ